MSSTDFVSSCLRGLVIAAACVAGACGPKLMKLPTGAREPAPDVGQALADATAACRSVTNISAEVAVSGSVGGQRLRGRLLTGLAAPASVRLEAVAPFGQPMFILVARGQDGTLLLPRDNRVLEHGRPADILEALTGVPLDAAELRTALTGCAAAPDVGSGRRVGDDWRVAADGSTDVYLHRGGRNAPWQIVSSVHHDPRTGDWRAEYRDFQRGLPRGVRLVSDDRKRFDLRLALSQVDTSATLGADVFRVDVPRGAAPITVEELRDAGPFRGK